MSGTNPKLPARELIAWRAYQRYVQRERGGRNGDELADWLAAEKDLAQFLNVPAPPAQPVSPAGEQSSKSTNTFLSFFGLREEPFGVTPDPAYLYVSRTHGEALASLSSGIADTRGFSALIAEPGMGKTTLLYRLVEQLRDSARTVLLFQTECTSREFIEYILQDLGVDVTGMGLVAMHGALNELLFEELLNGRRFVLVVDEAQNLNDSVLETIRMLSNFETHNAKLLQIILAGQPGLAAKLAQPRLSQLRQRIAVLSHLEPFTAEETRLYIEHRLKTAGYHGEPIFELASVRLIARHGNGIPRNINNLCHNSMQLSYLRGRRTVTPDVAQEALVCLDMESLASAPLAVAADSEATPVVRAAAANAAVPRPAPLATSSVVERQMKSSLTYGAGARTRAPRWSSRSAILAVILLSGTLLLAILGRSESKRRLTPELFDHTSGALGQAVPSGRLESAPVTYDATPEDTGNGQVLTVAVGPQQTLKDISLRYVGRFDSDLSQKILSLNPDIKDPDHLEVGQLIRIPLPRGAMRKVNDTADAANSSKPQNSGNLFTKFSALLRERK